MASIKGINRNFMAVAVLAGPQWAIAQTPSSASDTLDLREVVISAAR